MARSDRILDQFPAVYGAHDRATLLAEVVRSLALPLEEADAHLFRIQRAHRLPVADHVGDIIRLAGVLRLDSFHFEDIVNDPGLPHETKLAMMRERVQRIARLTLRGLGTPWAVIESAAVFLNAVVVPDHEGDPLIKQLDADGFSHRATVEFPYAPSRPRSSLVLHESPFRRNKVEMAPRWPGAMWAIENRTVDMTPIRLAIQGVGERTVMPAVFSPDLQEGVIFNGIVPADRTLVIDAQHGARLDDEPVDPWLITFQGGIFDHTLTDQGNFAVSHDRALAPFAGDMSESGDRWYGERPKLPRPSPGRSEWRFMVTVGVYDGRAFDFSVFDTPPEPVGVFEGDYGYDACVYDYPPSAVLGMAWDERIPCSFKLLLPPRVPLPGGNALREGERRPEVNYAGRFGAILPRFKAAGVRAFLDRAADGWLMGVSPLRYPAADSGEGIEFGVTRLQDTSAEVLVPFDPKPTG